MRKNPSRLGGALGALMGYVIGPAFGLVSFARRARMFHPRGVTFHADVAKHPAVAPELAPLAERVAGDALVRFSAALWKRTERLPDVLGCAIRLRREERPSGDDQDLLFATIRRPWTMPFSPFSTDVHDYLANDYFAVSPFDVGLGRSLYLRIHPTRRERSKRARRAVRLARAARAGRAVLELGVATRPFGPFSPIAVVTLGRVAQVDDEALRFRPFRAGRGLSPRGFVHGLRRGVYAMSQRARPTH